MVSHTECSGGGTHWFDEQLEDENRTDCMVHILRCGKCHEVCKHTVLVKANAFTFENCDSNECKGSEHGHDWNFQIHDYTKENESDIDRCTHCEGERFLAYIHNRTDYTGPDRMLLK